MHLPSGCSKRVERYTACWSTRISFACFEILHSLLNLMFTRRGHKATVSLQISICVMDRIKYCKHHISKRHKFSFRKDILLHTYTNIFKCTEYDEGTSRFAKVIWKSNILVSEGLWRWCITQRISGFLDFIHRPVFEGTWRFGNWICFRLQVKRGKKTPTQLGPFERANHNHWTFLGAQLSRCFLPSFYLRTETDSVSETSCSFKHWTMDKVQKPRDSLSKMLF
jgi:hypothetical protein